MRTSEPGLVVVWRVTERCDLGCGFCAYSRELRRPRAQAGLAGVVRFGKLLGEYAHRHGRPILVSWLGGEPLLWPPLREAAQAFKTFGLGIGVTTNGTRLDSEPVRRWVAESVDHLTLSVDGLGPFHDRCRGKTGLYDRLQKNVRRLRELRAKGAGCGPRLRVNTVLMRDNVREFDSFCEAMAGWGIEEITFNALGGRDRPEFFPAHSLQPEDVSWLRERLPALRQRMARAGLSVLGGQAYLERMACWARGEPIPIHDCEPGQRFLFVDERGLVAPCSFTGQGYGVPLREIESADDVGRLPQQFAARRRARRLSPCDDCPSTQVFGKFDPSPLCASALKADLPA